MTLEFFTYLLAFGYILYKLFIKFVIYSINLNCETFSNQPKKTNKKVSSPPLYE